MNWRQLQDTNPELYRLARSANQQQAGEDGHDTIEGAEWDALYTAIARAETLERIESDDPATIEHDNPHLQKIAELTDAVFRPQQADREAVDGAIGVTQTLAQDTPGRPNFWQRIADWFRGIFQNAPTLSGEREAYLQNRGADFIRGLGAEGEAVAAALRDPERRAEFTRRLAGIIQQTDGYDGENPQADAEALVEGMARELGITTTSQTDDDGETPPGHEDRDDGPADGSERSREDRRDPARRTIPARPAEMAEEIQDLTEYTVEERGTTWVTGPKGSVVVGRNGEVVVVGTNEDDVITVDVDPDSETDERGRQGVIVTINGESYRLTAKQAENLTIRAGKGNDQIWVAPEVTQNHHLDGGEGDDIIVGGGGRSFILGGAGDDRIYGRSGRNQIDAGDGDDLVVGGDSRDYIRGGAGDDELIGGAGDDVIFGEAGNDEIEGGDEDDRLYGGEGNDTIRGGDGIDYLFGGLGDDDLLGGADDDVLVDNEGANSYDGGEGEDEIWKPSTVRVGGEDRRHNVHVLEPGAPIPPKLTESSGAYPPDLEPRDIPFIETEEKA